MMSAGEPASIETQVRPRVSTDLAAHHALPEEPIWHHQTVPYEREAI
jgi:hypothetical protein